MKTLETAESGESAEVEHELDRLQARQRTKRTLVEAVVLGFVSGLIVSIGSVYTYIGIAGFLIACLIGVHGARKLKQQRSIASLTQEISRLQGKHNAILARNKLKAERKMLRTSTSRSYKLLYGFTDTLRDTVRDVLG